MALFRREAFEHQANRLYGDVHIALPGSWQLIGYLLLATLFFGGAFLALASFTRVESVSGAIVPDGGLSTLVAARPGIITTLAVENGAKVTRNTPLALISLEEFGLAGISSQEKTVDAVANRGKIITSRAAAIRSASNAEKSRDEKTLLGLSQEITSIEEQITMQLDLVASAQRDAKRANDLADKGFLSKQDLQNREEALTIRRQQLSNLVQQKIAKNASLATVRGDIAKTQEDLKVQLSGLEATRAELEQSLIGTESSRAYSVVSPIDGRIAALAVHVGQSVATGQPLMAVVPETQGVHAELYLSSGAMGFVAAGQQIRIAIDAFPFQRYGTMTARVASISTAPIIRADTDGVMKPIYLVTAELPSTGVSAFGVQQPLLPGMTLSARVIVRRQTLLRWLFEPLFAIQNR
jgi:membrane fusion protein